MLDLQTSRSFISYILELIDFRELLVRVEDQAFSSMGYMDYELSMLKLIRNRYMGIMHEVEQELAID